MSIIPAFPQPWAARFHDLARFVGKSELPPVDGDIAQLHDLRSRVYAALVDHQIDGDAPDLWQHTVEATAVCPDRLLRTWPADGSLPLLSAWKCEQ